MSSGFGPGGVLTGSLCRFGGRGAAGGLPPGRFIGHLQTNQMNKPVWPAGARQAMAKSPRRYSQAPSPLCRAVQPA